MSGGEWVSARAPAKVNLWLEVLGRRDDGYREVATLMAALDRADVVRARPRSADGLALRVGGPAASGDVPADERNLAWRAAALVLARARAARTGGGPAGLELELEKVVPSRAGLGGGSADAAAAWIAAERAFGLGPEPAARDAELGRLGSDCPFFARAAATGVAVCRGRGERVEPLDALPIRWNVAVVVPDIACATGTVYAACENRLSAPEPVPTVPTALYDKSESTVRRALFNRLEGAALRAYPELGAVRRWLDENGADHFRLSGSGSSFFGLFADGGAADEALARLRATAAGPLRGLFRARLGKGADLLP